MYNTAIIECFEEEGYPDSYGGAWLNTDSGRLVIGLTERSAETEQAYYDITGADLLEFQTVEYSLKEINDTMKETFENVSRANNAPQIKAGAIIQRTNSARMYVSEEDVAAYISESRVTMLPQNELESLKANPDIIEFKVGGDVIPESTVANVGEGFRSISGSGIPHASLGYLAYRYENGAKQVGVVTAAHTYGNREQMSAYTTEGLLIGEVTYKNWAENAVSFDELGTEDFAFIEFASGIDISSNVFDDTSYSQDLGIRYIIPAESSLINKSGVATGYTYGFVESLYYFSWDEQNLPGVSIRRILATYNSSPGDSGGIVYTSGSNGKAKVVGIHQGRMPEEVYTHSVCIPAYHLEAKGIFAGQ